MPEYINKTKFLEQLNKELSEVGTVHHDHIDLEKQMYEFAIKKVEDVDSEDVEIVMRAEWIRNSWNDYSCSSCGTQYVGHGALRWDYCPNCGAEMARMDTE